MTIVLRRTNRFAPLLFLLAPWSYSCLASRRPLLYWREDRGRGWNAG